MPILFLGGYFFHSFFIYLNFFNLTGLDTNMEVTLLTKDQIWGENALDVIKKYGTKTGCSDLMVLLGGESQWWCGYFCDDDPTYGVWTASPQNGGVCCVNADGSMGRQSCDKYLLGTRPVLPLSETRQIYFISERRQKLDNGEIVEICEFGEYPQDIVSDKISGILEKKFLCLKSISGI